LLKQNKTSIHYFSWIHKN